jgi:predicted PurR-regulated permease PerM
VGILAAIPSEYICVMGTPKLESTSVRQGMFLLLLFAVSVVFLGLISSFLMACFWAAIFAILFQGVFSWLTRKLRGRRSLAALMTSLIIMVSVVIPIGLISIAVVDQSRLLYDSIQNGDIDPGAIIKAIEQRVPVVQDLLGRIGMDMSSLRGKMESFITSAISLAGQSTWRYTQGAIGFVVEFFLMLYLLYFWVRDADKIVQGIRDAIPMGSSIEDKLFKKFAQVARATLKGTVIVAACQGLIGGMLFAILGIKAAVLWGVVMGVLSLLPVGGSAIIWVPAAIIMFVQGHTADGIIILVVGTLGIGLIDNLLRPILVGRETQMPDYLILLSTLGGITWFGLSGFIIGPVIAALFVICWEITGEMFGGNA